MHTPARVSLSALVVSLISVACADGSRSLAPAADRRPAAEVSADTDGGRYLVLFRAEEVPPGFADDVARLGGRLTRSLDEIGVATIEGLDADRLADLRADDRIESVEAVATAEQDISMDADDPGPPDGAGDALPRDAGSGTSPTLATLYAHQWNLRAVHADDAWAAGYLGWDKARVAIMDSGIDYLNPELAGLVDMESSASFSDDDAETKAQYPDREVWTDRFWHGTADASLVASAGRQLAGVNQQVTLIAVKVVNARGVLAGDGLAGIYWAVKQRADVMSFAGGISVDTVASNTLYHAYVRAFEYAWRKGVVSVTPGGDGGGNHDVARQRGRLGIPCAAPHVICVSLTAPLTDDPVDPDHVLPTNGFGSDITVAAPGGNAAFVNSRIWLTCTTSPGPALPTPPQCRPGQPAYSGIVRGAGTSWSSATVAGLAAMLVTKYGHNHPDLIRQRIIESADDLGAPGQDPYYGWGRVNVARALDVPIRRGRDGEAGQR
ncbi:MAG: S8 family serine peptidase [Gemmatimonadaceae bacterium]|nr:S8 family serine peptidase [Gemmatimonadaceae bacterium]NUQ91270.1 S8 family serine peptidase [Gemmatimonadaceae bacterium]NUR18279.1 S8 family serine peptidase [Gemmatimonadaceae bacterium]NUS95899.1 S8 family serine peptidase [Gemmatimonadaceae bacterium]